MKPTVGRIVHFFDHTRPRDASGKPGPFAAIVTGTNDPFVSLTVFPVGYPPFSVSNVSIIDASDTGVFWNWPPREAAPAYDASAELPRGHHAALGMAAVGDLDSPAPNHDDPTKRGFDPK